MRLKSLHYPKEDYNFLKKIIYNSLDINRLTNYEAGIQKESLQINIHKAKILFISTLKEILNFIDLSTIINQEDARSVYFKMEFESNLGIIIAGTNVKSSVVDVKLSNLLNDIEDLKNNFESIVVQTIEGTFGKERENYKKTLFDLFRSNANSLASALKFKNGKTTQKALEPHQVNYINDLLGKKSPSKNPDTKSKPTTQSKEVDDKKEQELKDALNELDA